jgi:lipopolysaccharide biosynthesis regulator YciM
VAVKTLYDVARLQRDKFNNIDAAADAYFKILGKDKSQSQASQELETLLRHGGRWEKLVELYATRASEAPNETEQIEALLKGAHVLNEQMQKPQAAIRVYGQVLGMAPEHEVALAQTAQLHNALGSYEEAANTLEKLAAVVQDPTAQAEVRENLGVVYLEQLGQADHAINAFTAAVGLKPDDRELRKLLARAYFEANQLEAAMGAFQQLLEGATTDDQKREAHFALGKVFDERLDDPAKAADHYHAALNLMGGERPELQLHLAEQLAKLYERAGNLQGYLDISAKQAAGLASTDPKQAAKLLARNCRLYAEKLDDVQSAINVAQQALALAPDFIDLRVYMADLYSKTPSQSLMALEEHRRIVGMGRLRPESIRALRQIWEDQRAFDKVYVASEVLTFLKAADDGEELFYNDNKKRVRQEPDAILSNANIESWVLHKSQRNAAHKVLSIVADQLGKAEPDDTDPLQVVKQDILKAKSDDPMRKICDAVANNLGGMNFEVWRTSAKPLMVEIYNRPTPVLAVGRDVTRKNQNREQRFLIARKLMMLRCGHHLIRGLTGAQVAGFLSAVGRAVDKTFPQMGEIQDFEGTAKRFEKSMSRAARKALVEPVGMLLDTAKRIDFDAFAATTNQSEIRGALVLCGAFDAAGRLVLRENIPGAIADAAALQKAMSQTPDLVDLTAYALSDDHFLARQALKVAIDA